MDDLISRQVAIASAISGRIRALPTTEDGEDWIRVSEVRESLKAELADREVEELVVGNYIVRWTSVLSNRFDSTAFKKVYGELYKAYTKQTASRRFSISV